jgi:RHS repeat-associated protein
MTVSSCSSKITDIGLSYTVLGQPSDVYESTPHSSGYYHVTESYWANGLVNQLSNLAGLPTISYGVDGEGRVYSASASSGQNPLTSTTYNVASLPTQVNLGSSDTDTYQFDANTNRMTQYSFNVNGQSVVGALTWNSIGTLESLSVTDPFYTGGNQSCSYTHDDLTRIASANCGTPWSQTFSYDAFGNLSKSGTISFQPTYSYLTNRMTQIGSSYPTYDANGNVLNDTIHAYAWDAAGRPVTIDTVGLTYDALGRMVEQNRSGAYTEIVYGPHGGKLALMSGQTLQKAFVPLAGGAVAVYNSSGLAYYRHSDWLGSSHFASTPTRTMYSDGAYAPFGEPYADSGTADLSFTGMNQDTVPGLFDFAAREYSTQGRWPSPDPSGMAAASLKDPQSWNRYAYVRNSPLHAVDPLGLFYLTAPIHGGGGGRHFLGLFNMAAAGYDQFSLGMDESIMNFDGSIATETEYTPGGFLAGTEGQSSLNGVGSIATGVSSNGGAQASVPTTPAMGDTLLTTSCDQSSCSAQATVTVNGNDPATNGNPNASPCYPGDLACNAKLNELTICKGPCISSSAQQTLGQAGTSADQNLKSAVANMGILDTLVVGGPTIYSGISALYRLGSNLLMSNPELVVQGAQLTQGLLGAPGLQGPVTPSNGLGRILRGLLSSPSDYDPSQSP